MAINDERLRFLIALKTWPVFGNGWARRVAEVKAFSLNLATHPIAATAKLPVPNQTVPAKGVVPIPKIAQKVTTATPVAAGGAAAKTCTTSVTTRGRSLPLSAASS